MKPRIRSGNLRITAGVSEMFGQDVLVVYYRNDDYFDGTEITIDGWTGEDFRDKIIPPWDKRILLHTNQGDVLGMDEPALFADDLYVCKLEGYRFGYNLPELKLNRDRNLPDMWVVEPRLGFIWSRCQDVHMAEQLIRSAAGGHKEKNIPEWAMRVRHKKVWQEAWQNTFENAVVKLNDPVDDMAAYMGINAVDLGNVGVGLATILPNTGRAVEEKLMTPFDIAVDDENIFFLRKVAQKAGYKGAVLLADLPEDTGGMFRGGTIFINVKHSPEKQLATLLHELAHAIYGERDATAGMVDAVCKIASNLLYEVYNVQEE